MPVTLTGVRHAFGDRPVLQGADLEVAGGESIAIMGPSGSGKTTLLSIIGLLVLPDAGVVYLDGIAVPRSGPSRHRLRGATFGWVLQTGNLLGRRTALANVALPLLVRGATLPEAQSAAAAALERVGLGGRLHEPARVLSGGEAQRVGIARAMAPRPRVVLADEPTGQLDDATSAHVLEGLFALLGASGSSLVVATHDPAVAAACDRVLSIVQGRVVER